MIVDPARAPADTAPDGGTLVYLSNAGGLTQFGAYVDSLAPGAWSSNRHWHDKEDEFILVLDGTVTLHDDAGLTDLHPGDAVCWPHGVANGHHLTNRGTLPCRYLIVGSRVLGDICSYPDSGDRQINGATRWQLVASDGSVLDEGDLPAELLELPGVWGRAGDGSMPSVIRAGSVPGTSGSSYPAGLDALGDYVAYPISDAGGLTQFGAFTETLMPGAQSSHRHWHAQEDEFLYVLAGEVTVIENDGPHRLATGGCACWPAGVANAHCLRNDTETPVTYFVAGSRLPEDEVTYPDIDLHYRRAAGWRHVTRKDGTPLPGWPKETNR